MKILVAEDDFASRKFMAKYLQKYISIICFIMTKVNLLNSILQKNCKIYQRLYLIGKSFMLKDCHILQRLSI